MVLTRTVLMALLASVVLAGCNNSSNNGTPPSITSFMCTPPSLVLGSGESVALTWTVAGANNLSIDNGVGQVTPVNSGFTSVQVTALGTTTFTLTATNTFGSVQGTCQVTVTGPGPKINSFTATPSVLLPAGGDVTLAWDVTGATGLSIVPDAGPITSLTTGSLVVLVTATTQFTVIASNDAGQNTASASVTVPPGQQIAGAVVDTTGQPIAGATVQISSDGGFSASALTDADGGFLVKNVPIDAYIATIIDPSHAVQYLGLTRVDPTLTDFVFLTPNRSATLAGQFSGGTYPEPAGYVTNFFYSTPPTSPQNLGDQPSGSYSPTIKWLGPTATTGTLYALQVHNVSGLPADYPGYGLLSGVALQDMGSLTGQNVALGPVDAGTLSGTVNPPVGYTNFAKLLSLVLAPHVSSRIALQVSNSAPFSYTTPGIPNASLIVDALARSAAGEAAYAQRANLGPNDTGITINIPAAPQLISPVPSATGVTLTTPFVWSAYSGGMSVLYISSQSSAPSFYVVTPRTIASIPDLADAGLLLPASTTYYWQVTGWAPLSSVDEFAGPGGLNQLNFVDSTQGDSVVQTFTTGP